MKTLKIAIVAFLSALAVNTVTAQEVKVTTEKRYYHNHNYYEPQKKVIVREHPEHTTIIREHEYGGYRPTHHRVIKTETRRYDYDNRYKNLNDDRFDNDRRWDDNYYRR